MKNENNGLQDFLGSFEEPPKDLKISTQKEITFGLNRNSIILKFVLLQLLGATLTLSFCPQFGVGLPEGHGITHVLRMYGDWACALFCGSIFLLAGSIFASTLLDRDQFYWVWKRYKAPLIFLPFLFWGGLMFFNLAWKLNPETVSYHLVWILSALLAQHAVFVFRERTYNGLLKIHRLH